MLALPWADDGLEFLMLDLFDGAIHIDKTVAQHVAQSVLAAQHGERLRQALRQLEQIGIGAAGGSRQRRLSFRT